MKEQQNTENTRLRLELDSIIKDAKREAEKAAEEENDE